MHSWHTRTANRANLGSHPDAKQVLRSRLPYCAFWGKDPLPLGGLVSPRAHVATIGVNIQIFAEDGTPLFLRWLINR